MISVNLAGVDRGDAFTPIFDAYFTPLPSLMAAPQVIKGVAAPAVVLLP